MTTKDEALRMALEALETLTDGHSLGGKKLGVEAITAVKEALAQPEQKPVAYAAMINGEIAWDADYPFSNEPFSCFDDEQSVPLYTTPPQRTWVGLTDEEIDECFKESTGDYSFACLIERKLKEKNT